MHREDRRRDEGGLGGNNSLETLKEQKNRDQVEDQVEGVIAGWIPASD
jgi:hypothetical protein